MEESLYMPSGGQPKYAREAMRAALGMDVDVSEEKDLARTLNIPWNGVSSPEYLDCLSCLLVG